MVGLAIGALTVGALVAALMAVWPRMDSTLPSGHAPTQALAGRDPSLLAEHVVVGTEAITLELPLPYTKPDGWRLCAQLAEGASVRSGTLFTAGGKLLSLRVRARGSADESLALDALSVQDEPPDLWACFSNTSPAPRDVTWSHVELSAEHPAVLRRVIWSRDPSSYLR